MRRRTPPGLIRRFAVPVILVSTIVLALVTLLTIQRVHAAADARVDAMVTRDTVLAQILLQRELGAGAELSGPDAQAFADEAHRATGDDVAVIGLDGTVIADAPFERLVGTSLRFEPEVIGAMGSGTGNGIHPAPDGGAAYRYQARTVTSADGTVRYVVRVGQSTASVAADARAVARVVIPTAVLGDLLIALVAVLAAQRLAGGIDRVAGQVRRLLAGQRVDDEAPGQVRELDVLATELHGLGTSLRQSVAEANATRAELTSTLSTLTDGVIMTDDDGIVIRINAAAASLFKTTPADAVGQPFMIVTRDHELNMLHAQAVADRAAHSRTDIEVGFDRRIIDAVAEPVVESNAGQTLVLLRDVTNLRRLERIRREFVANVSHELRTPLASIRVMVETLREGAVDEPDVALMFLDRSLTEIDRLTALVDELLDLARLESGRMRLLVEPVDAGDLIDRSAQRLSAQVERAGLDLMVDVPESLPLVMVDRTRIEQVLLNLINNAIKFTPSGGTITLSADVVGDRVAIHVRDTGVGISADELPRVFERFYKADRSRRSEGTGLGLAIAKHIVLEHGGEISVSSVEGKGAEFVFTVPVETSPGHAPAGR